MLCFRFLWDVLDDASHAGEPIDARSFLKVYRSSVDELLRLQTNLERQIAELEKSNKESENAQRFKAVELTKLLDVR